MTYIVNYEKWKYQEILQIVNYYFYVWGFMVLEVPDNDFRLFLALSLLFSLLFIKSCTRIFPFVTFAKQIFKGKIHFFCSVLCEIPPYKIQRAFVDLPNSEAVCYLAYKAFFGICSTYSLQLQLLQILVPQITAQVAISCSKLTK